MVETLEGEKTNIPIGYTNQILKCSMVLLYLRESKRERREENDRTIPYVLAVQDFFTVVVPLDDDE